MTENQNLKLQIIDKFANIEKPETIAFCREAYKFIKEDEAKPETPAQANVIADGVYFVTENNAIVNCKNTLTAPDDTKGVLVVQGERKIVVSLNDANGGEDRTLSTAKDPGKDSWNYVTRCIDAAADWNGKDNTEHLKRHGLNPDIVLEDGQYIPSMGEMLFIFTHRKEINEAMVKANADIIDDCWYWTSTEYSATHAWYLTLSYGDMLSDTKATYTYRVRPVSAFIA